MSTSVKLTLDQMKEIQARVAAGESQRGLAKIFGVHARTIGRAVGYSEDELLEQGNRKRRYKPRAVKVAPPVSRMPQDKHVDTEPQKVLPAKHIHRGTAVPTREGSYIQRDASGKIVRVLRCPVYDARRRFVARYDVDVWAMYDRETVGEGSIAKLSGETINGTLLFEYSGVLVKRVEFHPGEMTKEYMMRDRELRDGKPAVR